MAFEVDQEVLGGGETPAAVVRAWKRRKKCLRILFRENIYIKTVPVNGERKKLQI